MCPRLVEAARRVGRDRASKRGVRGELEALPCGEVEELGDCGRDGLSRFPPRMICPRLVEAARRFGRDGASKRAVRGELEALPSGGSRRSAIAVEAGLRSAA